MNILFAFTTAGIHFLKLMIIFNQLQTKMLIFLLSDNDAQKLF